jgi:putative DNA primase/helicase
VINYNEKFLELGVQGNSAFPTTDIGVSALFNAVCGENLRYVIEQKSWYYYNGQVWKQDIGSLQAMEHCKEFVKAYSAHIDTHSEDDIEKTFATKLTSRTRRECVLADARSNAPVSYDIFDRNKLLLNCKNGTFSLYDMTFKPHSPTDYITKVANVKYDPKAKCKRWERFIDEVMCGDTDTTRYLQKVCGYAISGSTEYEKLFVLHGASSRNGKSTLTETLSNLLGDYAKSCAAATISHRTTDGTKASPDLARLVGTRFVSISEPYKDLHLNAALVKQLTGGDTLVARFLNNNPFECRPEFKPVINTNHLPQIMDDTVFTSGRMVIIPFTRHFAENEQDKGLKKIFCYPNNLSGILNWLIEGYRLLKAEGLEPSERIKQSLAEYRQDSDVIGAFLSEMVAPSSSGKLLTRDLFQRYSAWLRDTGLRALSVQQFVAELRKRYVVKRYGAVGKVVVGVDWRKS